MSRGYGDASPSGSRPVAAKHKGGAERLLLSVRSKIGEALDVDGLPEEAEALLREAESLLRRGEHQLAQPRLGSEAEEMFLGADEHARRYLLQTYTEFDMDTVPAAHEATSPSSPMSPSVRTTRALSGEAVILALEKAGQFDFDAVAFSELKEVAGKPITVLGSYILSSCGYIGQLEEQGWISCPARNFDSRLTRFFTEIDRRYRSEVIYHNSSHAVDVMATLHWCLRLPYFQQHSSLLDFAVSVIAGAVHDVGHPGFNNDFQKLTSSELALRYNDQSVLENFHVATCFEVLQRPESNWFSLLKTEFREADSQAEAVNLQQYVRKLLVSIVLGTDMAKHQKHLTELQELASQEAKDSSNSMKRTEQLLSFAVHAADISNPCKPRKIMMDWTKRVNLEFWAQGDEERRRNLPISRMCDRQQGVGSIPTGQFLFIKHVVEPYMSALVKLCPEASLLTTTLEENKAFWQEKEKEKASFDDLFPGP